MKVSVDQRRLKARQMLVEASWAKSALIKALKDDDPIAAKKALNDLVSAQGYASSPAQELGLDDQSFKELSGALQKAGPGNMEIVRKILGVGKTEKPQQKSNVPGHVQKAQQKGITLSRDEANALLGYPSQLWRRGKDITDINTMKYDALSDLYEIVSQENDINPKKEYESILNKVIQLAQTKYRSEFKDSDFPDI